MPQLNIAITFLFAIGLARDCWLTLIETRHGVPSFPTHTLIPHPFNLPGIVTAIGGVLWAL